MAKNEKYWRRRLGKTVAGLEPYYHRLDLRPLDGLDTVGLQFILQHVKGIFMLDLDETPIQDDAIDIISRLEYVNELRLKSCHEITDACIPALGRINGLELLHVKGTKIRIDGLLHMEPSPILKTLLFSADTYDGLPGKMKLLRQRFPHCEFIIDGSTWYFND